MNAAAGAHRETAAVSRARGLSHVSFRLPDLDRARAFLTDFGLVEIDHPADALFMTGGAAPFVYRAVEGPAAFDGFGFTLASVEELGRLAAAAGAEVEPLAAPGGGRCVTLADPDGYRIEAVAGQRPTGVARADIGHRWNSVARQGRVGTAKRVAARAAQVERLGHIVLSVADFDASRDWYARHFGLLISDAIETDDGGLMGAFMRCDLGDAPTDHHTIFLAQTATQPSFRHAAFEVADLDDLMAGHEYLKARGHAPAWGVGRHVLGSQVFDYWLDPWGHMLEHWTDGDLLTRHDAPNIVPKRHLHEVQWGPAFPAKLFAPKASVAR